LASSLERDWERRLRHGAQLVEPDVDEVADVQCLSARRADRGVVSPEGRQHALHERMREPAVGYIYILCPIEQPFGAGANEDVGQLPIGLEVSRRRESAELAVLHSPRPIGRYEASDSHEVIVTCFGSDDL
jgi:hypothetical protein